MNERADRGGIEARVIDGSVQWYESHFNQNWKKLRAKRRPRGIMGLENIGLDSGAIDMRKFTPASLQELVDVDDQHLRFDVLIAPNPYPTAGPFHTEIEALYGYKDASAVRNMHRGEIFESSEGKKYLLMMMNTLDLRGEKGVSYRIEANGQEYQEQLTRDLARYGITALFLSPHTNHRDYSVQGVLAPPDYLAKRWEEHVLERFARGVAMQRGWTHTQYLRFRLTGEMPKAE